MSRELLLKKYDVPVPRYTSYPTVPCWNTSDFTSDGWWSSVERCFAESNDTRGISLYVHLPFCESLCTYCACNTRITKNHAVEETYLRTVLDEWRTYRSHFDRAPVIREIHLGGGTPTFFSAANLARLINGLLEGSVIHPDHEFSIEGHPNNTTHEHLETLACLGFRRVSFGVQDLDPKVQRAINRIQPFENLKSATLTARALGYQSVSFDLIYGLPYQTLVSVQDTISRVIELKPDRIAYYSYAHVPWIKPGQRGYEDADLPGDVVKRSLYEQGRALFLNAGYIDIGMDHFSLPEDSLAVASKEGRLHRNFMGYTTSQSELLIGLGTSAISDSKYAYAQNDKKVETYREGVKREGSAIVKGHLQTDEDRRRRALILDIVCRGEVLMNDVVPLMTGDGKRALAEMMEEGIVETTETKFVVTQEGRAFIRNLASLLDARMGERNLAGGPLFSKAI